VLVRGTTPHVRCIVCDACLRVTVKADIVGEPNEHDVVAASVVTGLQAVGLGCPNGHRLTPEDPGVRCDHAWSEVPSHANETVQVCPLCRQVRTIPKSRKQIPQGAKTQRSTRRTKR
jgi:hypothetical protein